MTKARLQNHWYSINPRRANTNMSLPSRDPAHHMAR
jgi:hypothetical protein